MTRIDVPLSTLEAVQSVLQEARVPVSRNDIMAQLRENGHPIGAHELAQILEYLFDLGFVIEGSKGVQWTRNESPSLKRASAFGARL